MAHEQARRLPDSSPLAYFGNWCGAGWSADQRTTTPLTAEQSQVAIIRLKGAAGNVRDSPVDAACKVHDQAYDFIAGIKEPVRAARATVVADRRLYDTVSRLLRQHAAGKNDLNMGEVLYGRNVQIAFGSKLIVDRMIVANAMRTKAMDAVNRRGQELAMRNLPNAIVLALAPAGAAPFIARLVTGDGR